MKKNILLLFSFILFLSLDISATVVTLTLNDHNGTEINSGVTWHYRIANGGAWLPITSGTDLPDLTNYNFRVTYGAAGENINKIQDITQNPDIVFQTKEVTLTLLDSDNIAINSGVTWHYRVANGGSWQTISSPLEMLPKTNYNFRVTYGAAGETSIKYRILLKIVMLFSRPKK